LDKDEDLAVNNLIKYGYTFSAEEKISIEKRISALEAMAKRWDKYLTNKGY